MLTILEDFGLTEEFQIAKSSPTVDAARQRILADITDAAGMYRKLFSLDLPNASLVLVERWTNAVALGNVHVAPVGVRNVPDVTYHEVAHPFVSTFIDMGSESGALSESVCEVLSACVKQRKLGRTPLTPTG